MYICNYILSTFHFILLALNWLYANIFFRCMMAFNLCFIQLLSSSFQNTRHLYTVPSDLYSNSLIFFSASINQSIKINAILKLYPYEILINILLTSLGKTTRNSAVFQRKQLGTVIISKPEGVREGSSYNKLKRKLLGQHLLIRFFKMFLKKCRQLKVTQKERMMENNTSASSAYSLQIFCNGSHWRNPSRNHRAKKQDNTVHPSQYLRAQRKGEKLERQRENIWHDETLL